MSVGNAERRVQDAEYASSSDNKVKLLCEAVKNLCFAVRELEAKVRTLEGRQ